MERVELDQYRNLCREIRYLEEKIKKMPKEASVVKGSSLCFPYLEKQSRAGEPDEEERALRKVLYQRRARCLKMKHRIYHFTDSIVDSRARLIFELRYIDGWSWQKMSMYMGSLHKSYARKIHDRYFEER